MSHSHAGSSPPLHRPMLQDRSLGHPPEAHHQETLNQGPLRWNAHETRTSTAHEAKKRHKRTERVLRRPRVAPYRWGASQEPWGPELTSLGGLISNRACRWGNGSTHTLAVGSIRDFRHVVLGTVFLDVEDSESSNASKYRRHSREFSSVDPLCGASTGASSHSSRF